MVFHSPSHFSDYELLDCGNNEKLERFGKYISIRPENQAIWDRKMDGEEWERLAHVRFIQQSSYGGIWKKYKSMPDVWNITYTLNEHINLTFELHLTSFKHLGVFPEQAVHWEYIYEKITLQKKIAPVKFLNLFAYTGGASLAAKAAGADVVHLDSVRQVVSWAKKNMEASGLNDIRWVIDDAMKFVKREQKRGNKYQGIILDPPAYGHGPDKEQWKLEDNLNEMVKTLLTLLDEKTHFFILNTYSLGFSSLIMLNLLNAASANVEYGELYLPSTSGTKLPVGVFGRFCNP